MKQDGELLFHQSGRKRELRRGEPGQTQNRRKAGKQKTVRLYYLGDSDVGSACFTVNNKAFWSKVYNLQ